MTVFRLRVLDVLATVEAPTFFLARARLAVAWQVDPQVIRLYPPRRSS